MSERRRALGRSARHARGWRRFFGRDEEPDPAWWVGMWVAVILALTLWPTPSVTTTSGWCILCGDRGLADALLNLALFVPLGLGLRGRGARPLTACLLGLCLSLLIESTQFFLPGRDASIGDILANGVGSGTGAWLRPGLPHLARPDAALARLLSALWAAGLAGSMLLVAWLLEPIFPGGELALAPRPPAPAGGVFMGEVLELAVDGRPARAGARAAGWDGSSDRGERIDVRFEAVPPRVSFRPLVGLTGDGSSWPMLLGPKGRDLILRFDRRAYRVRLTKPDLRFREVLGGMSAADTLRVGAERVGDAVCLYAGERRECGLGHTVGSGWALLLPPAWANGSRDRWIDALWLAALMVPLGYWRRPGLSSWLALGSPVAVAAALPAVTTLLAAPITFGGLAAGGIVGRILASRVSRVP